MVPKVDCYGQIVEHLPQMNPQQANLDLTNFLKNLCLLKSWVHWKQRQQLQQKRHWKINWVITHIVARIFQCLSENWNLKKKFFKFETYPIRVFIGSPFICFDVLFPHFKFTTWWWCWRWIPDGFMSSPMNVSVAFVVVVNITPPSGMMIWPRPELFCFWFKAFRLPTKVSFSAIERGVSFPASSSYSWNVMWNNVNIRQYYENGVSLRVWRK